MKNTDTLANNRKFSIAPMMDWSDRHCRYFWRLLTKEALLYTEMVTTGALIHGDRERFLNFDPIENPVALQLGGSNADDLARCAQWAQEWGYNEVNINCGCPSDRVQSGMFGACLMAEPQLVAKGVAAMRAVCDIPVTVKHRIGIDDMEHYDQLVAFIEPVAAAGCSVFIVHARKAWLKGLSPKENREVPPLNYPWVYRLKKDYPELTIVINGGINSIDECEQHLKHVDGVMIGREAYQNPWMLSEVDSQLFASRSPAADRDEIIESLLPYIKAQIASGARLNHITRHILGLYQGVPGARKFRRHISENAYAREADINVLAEAFQLVKDAHGQLVARSAQN